MNLSMTECHFAAVVFIMIAEISDSDLCYRDFYE